MRRVTLFDLFAVQVCFTSPHPERLLNWILRKNVAVWRICRDENWVSFRILPFRKRVFRSFRDQLTAEETWEESPCGLLHLVSLFRRRLGFFLGLTFLSLSLFCSTLVLWSVDVEGNVSIPDYVIRDQLVQYGLVPGRRLDRISARELALLFQSEHSEYVYVGINVIGTRAKVEIRERDAEPEKPPSYEGASNQVARTYGRIVRYEVLSGQVAVRRGDYVTEGALLISGVHETVNGTFSPVRAAGRVFAETQREFSVRIPLEESKTVYDPKEKTQKSYEILGLSLTFPPFAKSDDRAAKVLESCEEVRFFGHVLPILVRERLFLKSREKKEVIEVDRAEKLAYDKYEQYKRGTFGESDEILSENVSVRSDGQGVLLTAELRVIENICREAPFRFTTDSGKS